MSGNVWVIAYDIAKAKRWRKVFRLLKSYGGPVQYSVFECEMTSSQMRTLQAKLGNIIEEAEDRIHFYPLCGQCSPRAIVMGRGGRVDPLPDVWIVSESEEA